MRAVAPLVTAIVPAYNAARTINETLQSIRAQTYANLEIIVVDDGSTDDTPEIVHRHASADHRVRLIRQENAGVAAARNRGIGDAYGEYVAPVDADDLWSPTKIEKQMARLLGGGTHLGLVYTWQALIDGEGKIVSREPGPLAQGQVMAELLHANFVGSGSPALMRKQAVFEAGGYDSSLRAKGAEGCEDWQLYIRIAERYEFAVITEHLTGYRQGPGRMSSDRVQMLRSHFLVAEWLRQAFPQYSKAIDLGCASYGTGALVDVLLAGKFTSVLPTTRILARDPLNTLRGLSSLPMMAARGSGRALWKLGQLRKQATREDFLPMAKGRLEVAL